MNDLSLPLRRSSRYLLRNISSSSCINQWAYLIDVASLIVVVDQCSVACVGHLFLLLDAGQIIDGFVCVTQLETSEALPEHVERIVGALVELSAGFLQRLPELLPD